jgi:hypothetical protein
MLYKDRIKFDAATITNCEYDFLYDFVKRNNIKTVLEFGTGASTYCFLENNCKITTFETSKRYIPKVFPEILTFPNCVVVYYTVELLKNITLNETFDLTFVDGPFGKPHLSRLESCLFSMKYSNHLLLHDFKRKGEIETVDFLTKETPAWKSITINTRRKIGYLYKSDKTNPFDLG